MPTSPSGTLSTKLSATGRSLAHVAETGSPAAQRPARRAAACRCRLAALSRAGAPTRRAAELGAAAAQAPTDASLAALPGDAAAFRAALAELADRAHGEPGAAGEPARPRSATAAALVGASAGRPGGAGVRPGAAGLGGGQRVAVQLGRAGGGGGGLLRLDAVHALQVTHAPALLRERALQGLGLKGSGACPGRNHEHRGNDARVSRGRLIW